MTDDIVERLRELARNYADGVAGMTREDHFAWEAAAEIERLHTLIEDDLLTYKKLMDEIARLRAALLTCPCPGGGYTGMPKDTEPTIGACITAGVCGCCYGDALKTGQ